MKLDKYLDSDSDVRDDSNEDGTDEEDDDDDGDEEPEFDLEGSSDEGERGQDGGDKGDEPMDRFELDPGIVVRYGICQLFLGDKEKADNALRFLKDEEPNGPHSDMMIEVAKVRHFSPVSVESNIVWCVNALTCCGGAHNVH